MDPLLTIISWTGAILFVGLCLFGLIGNYLLAHNKLSGEAAVRVRRYLAYLSDDPAAALPGKPVAVNSRLSQLECEYLLKQVSEMAVDAAGLVSGKTLSEDDQKRLSEAVMKRRRAGAEREAAHT